MLFAIDDSENPIEIPVPLHMGAQNRYKFTGVTYVTEDELFANYKKRMFITQSKQRIMSDDVFDPIDVNYTGQVAQQVSMSGVYRKRKMELASRPPMRPYSGSYIIPRMFGYFPFLDCDDGDVFEECKFNLTVDGVPFVAYESSVGRDSYWIFCDKQLPLMSAIDFIEQYPCDHRYAWIARHKKELCVRALPKTTGNPAFNEDFLVSSFTDDFKYWIAQFNDYWINGKIPNYIEMIDTANAI